MSSDISSANDISWIRLALTARYPKIVADKGADLDNNGQIEGNETFGDLDGSGAIDNKDFWMYLERNRPSIANQIEFFKWQGNNISDDNIINHLMLVESQLCKKEKVQKAYGKINDIIARVQGEIIGNNDPVNILAQVYYILQNDFSIRFKNQDAALFIDNLLTEEGELDCDTTTFLFLAIAHECKWPLFAVSAPSHLFMRWDDGRTTFNMDNRYIFTNDHYQKWLHINEKAIKNGVYLKSLSQNQTIASFYSNRGYAKISLGDNRGAIKDCNEAIRLDPKSALAYHNRGAANLRSWHFVTAWKDFNSERLMKTSNTLLQYIITY